MHMGVREIVLKRNVHIHGFLVATASTPITLMLRVSSVSSSIVEYMYLAEFLHVLVC